MYPHPVIINDQPIREIKRVVLTNLRFNIVFPPMMVPVNDGSDKNGS